MDAKRIGEAIVAEQSFHSTILQGWLERIRAGDASAREELLRCVGERLEALTRKMLRNFPAVKRCDETGDVFQGAMLRLLRCLRDVEIKSTRDFMNLAAVQIRRELLDLARLYARRHRLAPTGALVGAGGQVYDPPESQDDGDLERWARFHEGVDELPTEEREVVSLIFYHGWTQTEVAACLQIGERTVRRRWESALLTLRQRSRPDGSEP